MCVIHSYIDRNYKKKLHLYSSKCEYKIPICFSFFCVFAKLHYPQLFVFPFPKNQNLHSRYVLCYVLKNN